MKNGLQCTYMCKLQTWENQKLADENENVGSDSDFSDVESDEEEED